MKRTIGPVTGTATMGTAVGVLLVGLASRMGVTLSGEEAGAIVILGTGLGGWAARPPGRHL